MTSNVIQVNDLVLYFSCTCAEMIIWELPSKFWHDHSIHLTTTQSINQSINQSILCYILNGYVIDCYTLSCVFDLLVLCVRINDISVIFNLNCNTAFLPMASIWQLFLLNPKCRTFTAFYFFDWVIIYFKISMRFSVN